MNRTPCACRGQALDWPQAEAGPYWQLCPAGKGGYKCAQRSGSEEETARAAETLTCSRQKLVGFPEGHSS